MSQKSLTGGLLLCLALAARSDAQTVTLQPAADAWVQKSTANQSHGADPTLELTSGDSHVLLRFDQAAIAAAVGSGRLVSASLELFVHAANGNWGADGHPVEAHALTAAWTEAGVTWNCAADTNPANSKADCTAQWSGGSFSDDISDSVLQTSAVGVWMPFDVTADVAGFLAGTPNQGWLITKEDTAQGGKVDYGSREGAAAERPRLVLLVESAAHDQVPPVLAITSPSQPILVNEPSPAITVEYADGGSGVDTATLQVLVDGQDVTASCTTGAASASCRAPNLAAGDHAVQAVLKDKAGNAAQASFAFKLLLGPGPHVVTFSAVGDTYLRKGEANKNSGTEPIVRIRESGANRGLVQFDAQSLATTLTGATLVSASLELHIEKNGRNWGKTGRTVDAHRLTSAWTETGATWNCPSDSNPTNGVADCAAPWSGGGFIAIPTASVLHTRDLTGWVSYDVTADVAAFAAGTADFGWLLKKTDETKSGRVDYDSREGTAGEGPRLVVVFTTVVAATPPVVTITTPADGKIVNTPNLQVTGTVTTASPITSFTVNGSPVSLSGNSFQTTVTLAEGGNTLVAEATSSAGTGTAAVVVILDTTPPTLTLDAPLAGQATNQAAIRVAGSASDENGIASVQVNGVAVPLTGDRFETTVPVPEGVSSVVVQAVDLAGNGGTASVDVRRFSLPAVTITSPLDLSYLAATTATVTGTVSGPVTAVTVNGVDAQVSGTTFTAADVPLIEGGNILTAATTDANGHVGTASINVVRDLTPPRVTIDDPPEGSKVLDATVMVAGLVNDIVDGTVNAAEATVTVNGRPAAVANRSYTVDVPLALGDNVLTAVATDRSGNTGQASITVHRDPPGVPRVAAVSGDRQQAVIGTLLPAPLTVTLLDVAGQPVQGKPVLFSVRGNDGSLDGGKRQIAVLTDANGQAVAHFTLGTRVGVANQVVAAEAVGFRGPVLFRATAQAGNPILIVEDSGNQQVGIAGQAVPRPLVAVVTDAGYNRLPGVPVRFKVAKGQGHFADGTQDFVATTDSDGRAIVPWILDPEEGIANNVVEARIDSLPDGPLAGFVATGRVAGDPALTTVSGVVLDNSNQPVPGVTVRILDTAFTAQTDARGLFHIGGAPVGTVKLIVDGSTSQRPGAWPDLEFVLTTIPGRDNDLGMPIYLLPLDLQRGLVIDETHGGTLTLPDVPGFALDILAGSVTFPGGSKSGVVSVTVVHNDKVPMVPNFGQQPRLIVTIQPAGARFEPPARLTLPNVEGFAPGQVAEMYSFDHDLGHFVSIGPGTVSEDGSVVISNHGVGIVKAGWHCCGFPQGTGAPNHCPECTKCSGDDCVPTKLCEHCGTADSGHACNGQGNCFSGRNLIPQICNQLKVVTANLRPILPSDPLVAELHCGINTCLAGFVEDVTEVTHSCDTISMARAQISETVAFTSSGGCPEVEDIDRTTTCFVAPDNRLFSIRLGGGPCEDTHAICPPLNGLPIGTCTIKATQTYFVDGCAATIRTLTYTFGKSPDGLCTGIVH